MKTELYFCDPRKNTKCSKTACHINKGLCALTTDKTFAVTGLKRWLMYHKYHKMEDKFITVTKQGIFYNDEKGKENESN